MGMDSDKHNAIVRFKVRIVSPG